MAANHILKTLNASCDANRNYKKLNF